jgi:hypothetical protein
MVASSPENAKLLEGNRPMQLEVTMLTSFTGLLGLCYVDDSKEQ